MTRLSWGGEEWLVLSYPLPIVAMPASLTPAEREVLCALLEGMALEEVARHRSTAMRTVANQVASIYRKVGVSSRSELLAALIRR